MPSFFRFTVFLIKLFPLFVVIYSANATVYNINTNNNIIENDGFCSVSEAVHAANLDQPFNECAAGEGDDTVVLHNNIIITQGFFDKNNGSSGLPPIASNIIFEGNGFALSRDENLSCEDDNEESEGEFRLLYITTDGGAFLKNLTIENGCSHGPNSRIAGGGAILNYGNLSLLNTQVINNQAKVVGAIWNDDNAIIERLENCQFINNESKNGGAMVNGGIINIIKNCKFINNSAGQFGFGGAINNNGHIELIQNSLFISGLADGGGAIFNGSNGTINIIMNSRFSENTGGLGAVFMNLNIMNIIQNNQFVSNSTISSGHGAVLYNLGSIQKINNNTFSENVAGVTGGVFFNFAEISELINNTFSNNSALLRGSAFENAGDIFKVENNTFFNNTTTSIYNRGLLNSFVGNISSLSKEFDCQNFGTITNEQHNFADTGNCFQTLTPIRGISNTLNDNGCLIPLVGGGCVKTHSLLAKSNGLNLVQQGVIRDQRGFISNGIRDAGSFEFNSETIADLIYMNGFE